MPAADAREAVLQRLEDAGLFVKADDYSHAVGTCYRCGTIIEPLLSLQWFMDMERLAAPAIKAVEDGRVKFFPARWGDVYLDWMRGLAVVVMLQGHCRTCSANCYSCIGKLFKAGPGVRARQVYRYGKALIHVPGCFLAKGGLPPRAAGGLYHL